MNILFLSTRSPYPLISGHSLRTYHILKGATENHNVTLVTFIQLKDELKRENIEHLRRCCRAVYHFRIPVDLSRIRLVSSLFLNLFSPFPFVVQKYNSHEMRRKIREIIKKDNIDLVHVDMLPLTVYLNEFRQLPCLLVNHNVESMRLYRWYKTEFNIIKKAYLGIQWYKLRSFERSAMDKVDCGVVVSETDKKHLVKMGVNNRLFVVPNGTDTAFFKPLGKKIIEDSVLWMGHMDVHTNKDAVLYFWKEIYPLVRRQHPAVKMTFLGTSPPKEIAEAAILDNQIRVTGFVDDIRSYVDEAAVMVVPIRIGSGTRIKILDGMAMGKAIVSTSVGCEGLNVSDGKNILIADNPQDFANRTVEILKNGNMRMKIEKEALKLAKSFDWSLINEKQETAYYYIMKKENL